MFLNLSYNNYSHFKQAISEQEIARRLRDGETYISIQKSLGVSSTTVSNVSRIVKNLPASA